MALDIRLPNINANTEAGQLIQIKSYLYQLVEQLKWAMENIEQGGTVATTSTSTAMSTTTVNSVTATNTFNAIKSLIIKSADIVDAYYEQINERLEGIYVAQSEFGTYSEQTSQVIEKNSTDITQVFNNVQMINSVLEEIENTLINVNAYIKSGLLAYDESGIPIYGLEIGQRNSINGEEVFDKYARFSSNRLSFFDQNDTEVAYISDFKLHITDADIAGTLTLGGYEVDTSNGLIFRWIGGR